MEHVQRRKTTVELVTSKSVIIGGMIFLSVLFGVLNFIIPTHILAAVIIIVVSGLLLFMYPFVGLLVYQFITIIQPGVLFPSLAPLHVERLMAIFLIVSLVINIKLRRGHLVVTQHRLLILIGLFIVAMVASVPTSYWKGQSVDMIIEFLKMLAYILLIINIVKTPTRLRIFVWQYILLIGYIAVSSAIAYKTGNYVEAQGIVRAQGLAGTDPNTLAITLVLSLPLHFMTYRLEKSKILKALSAFIVLATIYTMVLTGSRGGFVGLGVVTLMSWWILPKRGVRLFALLAVGFIVIAVMPAQYQERYASIFSSERDDSSKERLGLWTKGMRMFFDHPFTGVGTDAFGTANAEGYSEGRKSYLLAHNLYVQLLAELGIVGLITFGSYVVGLFYYMRKYRKFIIDKYRKRTWIWGVLMAMTLSTITLLVVGMFGHNLYRINWYFYGALTMAIGLILRNYEFKEAEL